MAIPKRGSRQITVDGTLYLWRVRQRPTYSQANGWAGLNVAVERGDAAGSVLVVRVPRPHPGNWAGAQAVPLLPSEVERFIRDALSSGWRPSEPGGTFYLDAAGDPA